MALVLGLNSGSSFDGVDAVVVEINNGPDGYPARARFIGGNSYAWPDAVAEKVLCAFGNTLSVFELCRLNYVAGSAPTRICAEPPTRGRPSDRPGRPSVCSNATSTVTGFASSPTLPQSRASLRHVPREGLQGG